MQSIQFLIQKITVFFQSFSVAPTYIQAGSIVVLLFLLIVSLAQFRQHFVKWSFKGGLIGLFFGFLLTILLEGFLLLSGHTVITGLLGWKNAPKPFSTALDLGKNKLINVLGVSTSNVTATSATDAISVLQTLNPDEIKKIKAIICTP